jgi:hypothetical protein
MLQTLAIEKVMICEIRLTNPDLLHWNMRRRKIHGSSLSLFGTHAFLNRELVSFKSAVEIVWKKLLMSKNLVSFMSASRN